MAIDPKQAALTAINEAITALDYESTAGITEADDLIVQARESLLDARARLTNKPWPTFGLMQDSRPQVYAAWHTARAEEQRKDGRQ